MCMFICTNVMAQIAVNSDGSAPDNSAMLDVKSTVKGLLAPRMTQVQRIAIVSPATGLIVYQTDLNSGYYFNAGTTTVPNWRLLSYDGSTWQVNGSDIFRITGNVGIGTSTPTMKLEVTEDAKINGLRIGRGTAGMEDNTVLGSLALNSNTTGLALVAIGYRSLYSNTTGASNSAIGFYSMFNNTSGDNNCAFGYFSLKANVSGDFNTAIGSFALADNTSGTSNTIVGRSSCNNNTTGSFNSSLGYNSLHDNTTGYSNVAIGVDALYNNTVRGNLIAIGDSVLYYNGMNATATYHGSDNTAIGSKAMWYNTTGYNNTALGFEALHNNSGGYANTCVGRLSLTENTTGYYNTALGRGSLDNNTTGYCNTAVGGFAGDIQENISFGTFVGYTAYPGSDALSNVGGFGYNARPTASDQVRIGNSSVSSIGGYAGWTDFSDGRYKTNIKENVMGLKFIMKLRPITYQLDVRKLAAVLNEDQLPDPDGMVGNVNSSVLASRDKKAAIVYTGFIAQEVEKAAKEVGYDFSGVDAPKNSTDFYGLRYGEFVVPLVKAIQEQQKEIESLKLENKHLSNENKRIQAGNEALEKRISAIEQQLKAK